MSFLQLASSVQAFKADAEAILGFSEQSVHRLAELSSSYAAIDKLTLEQTDMLRQSLRCVEVGVFRAAHVLAWAAIADYLQGMASDDNYCCLNRKYPDLRLNSLDDLRDRMGEHHLIEAMFQSGMLAKSEKKALHALLNKRNECAHPSDYFPDLNQSLGFVSECIVRLSHLKEKYGKSI